MILSHRRSWRIRRLLWFDWRDPHDPHAGRCSICASSGLLHYDRSRKRAYFAFSLRTRGEVSSPPNSPGYARGMGRWWLLVRPPDGAERRVPIDGELLIGRGVEGDGRLTGDPEVSREHARISASAERGVFIEDLGSGKPMGRFSTEAS